MSPAEVRNNNTTGSASSLAVDMKLEVVVIPRFRCRSREGILCQAGWRLDADRAIGDNFRLVQFTPPGSGASIQFGASLTSAAPGSSQGLLLIVSDIVAARQQLATQGIEASEVFHCESGTACRFPGIGARVSGPQPERVSYFSFVSFQDPDGNGWVLQEVTSRLAGRVTGNTTFTSAQDLGEAMIRAANAHGEDAKQIRQADPDWPYWQAEYMVREQSG
jgi:hypothetical protein